MNYKSMIITSVITIGIISIPFRHYVTDETIKGEKIYEASLGDSPECLEMFSSLVKNSEKYGIPKKYAFGIAYVETRYKGPNDWNYKGSLISPAGALGPMQIMPSTAKLIWGEKVSKKKLLNNIDFNVETSMILLKKLHDKYKDWKIVFGCYNTGRPCINDYAEKVFNFKPKNI
jgi:soluble lytic murein transglycosylase-like protein